MSSIGVSADALDALIKDTQRHHGQNIYNVFDTGDIRSALLWADVQAGKTGTYHYVIRQMLKNKKVDHVYILCGSSETTLKKQAVEDLKKYNHDNIDQITVLFRNDFKKGAMKPKRALIVIDESHMDQTIGMQLDKFLVSHSLYLDGTSPEMAENNTFILTVDATPYSEYSAWFHGKSRPKHVEKFIPSDNYYGIQNYLNDGHISATFDFRTDEGKCEMAALMARFPCKYLMFRVEGAGNKAKSDVLRALCRKHKYNFLEYTEGKDEIAITRNEQKEASDRGIVIPCMEDAPTKTTVILVKGRLRAGKVVPKAHVGFVWENATTTRTDSIVQGLLGRMCGYLLEEGKTDVYKVGAVKPLVFLPKAILEKKTDTVIPMSELDRHLARDMEILPRCGANLKKGHTTKAADEGRTQVPIFRIKRALFGEDAEYFTSSTDTEHLKDICRNVLRDNFDAIIEQHADQLNEEQIFEIHDRVFDDFTELFARRLEGTKHHSGASNSYFKQLHKAHAEHTAPSEHMEGSPYITFAMVINPKDEPLANPGDVYVVMYTDAANPEFTSTRPTDRIAEENGKSLFSVRVHDAAVAGGAATIDLNATRSIDDLLAAITEYIGMSRRGVYVSLTNSLVSVHDKFVFDKTVFAYTNSKVNALEQVVKPALERTHGIRIKFTYNSGPSARTTFAVKKISWE